MKLKDIEVTEEEIIQSLKDVGIEVLTPNDADFNEALMLGEQVKTMLGKEVMIDKLQSIICELEEHSFWNKTNIKVQYDISWNELCDKGIEILTKLKECWEE